MTREKTGSALIIVMTLATILLLSAIVTSMASVSDVNITREEKIKTMLEFACESGLNRAKAKIEQSYNNGELSTLEPEIYFQGDAADATGLTPEEKAYMDEEYYSGSDSESPDYYQYNVIYDDGKEITVKYAIYQESDWEKTQAYTSSSLKVEAIAYSNDIGGWVGMQENATTRRSTLFMYNIFFVDELEILPGPTFNLKGLIHTNKDLYLNSDNTLTIKTNSMTAAGEMFRRRFNNTESGGTVKISKTNENGTLTNMERSPKQDSTNTEWKNLATSRWEGTVRDKHLGATVLEAPKLQSFEPNGYYDQQAGLRIKVLAKGRATPVYEITYNDTVTLTNANLSNALSEAQFYDRRESTSKKISTTQIDLTKLKNSGYWPDNGLIYMSRDDAVPDTDGNPYSPSSSRVVSGFKLINGSVLPEATTFVSNEPVYIKGDFNLHSNSNPSLDTWQPAAVIADAITVLSNSWNDANSSSMQAASNTTQNLVFITGNVPTNPSNGQYSGGFENFPRLLENWSPSTGQKTLTLKGGFMQLFRSQYATANWSYGSYYTAPIRNWSAEERFADLSEFPPSFTDLFPSTNFGIVFTNWSQMSRDEALLSMDED